MKNYWFLISLISMILFQPLFYPSPVFGASSLGEGTGHQRVVEILGRPIPESKVHINTKSLPWRTRILNVKDVQLIILNSDEVVKMNEIERINYAHNPANFENFNSFKVRLKGLIEKEDIFALVTK